MTYFERFRQLENTLASFLFHGYGEDVEVILVDDGSEKEPIRIIGETYPFSVKVIQLDPRNKWYHNSCVPFNAGLSQCSGDFIIIQNAECLHYSNIVNYVKTNLNESNYLAFGCYSINSKTLDRISAYPLFTDKIGNIRLEEKRATFDGEEGWYNHSTHVPVAYHFCAALTKTNLKELRGFDPAYAKGIGFDDNELLFRIREKRLRVTIVNDHLVIHQYHYTNRKHLSGRRKLINRNRIIYFIYTKNQSTPIYYILSLLIYYFIGWHGKCASFLKYAVKFINGSRRFGRMASVIFGRFTSLVLRCLIEPLFVPLPDVSNIPVVINNRNRVTYLRALIEWLIENGMNRIYVLDNGSDFPPLLKYYAELDRSRVEILKLGRNVGSYSLWSTGHHKRFWKSYYIYSDSDVVPSEGFGLEGIRFLLLALRKHKSLGKIGFGIRIDDLPEHFAQKEHMKKIESKYHSQKIGDKIFHAAVDTTFALYAPFHKGGPELNAGRTDHPFVVRHLPWYIDSNRKSDEEKYFESHATTYSSMYMTNVKMT